MRAVWAWLLMLAVQCTFVQLVAAQPQAQVPVRSIGVNWQNGPQLSFSARDFVDAEVVKKLQSGLPQTLVLRTFAYGELDHDPLALTVLSCRVVYDLWDGVYRVERQTEASDRIVSAKSLDVVIAQCLTMQGAPIGDPASWKRVRGSDVYFAVIVELNPLSPDAVQRIRRWLARPAGSELSGNAFFGSFVSIFVGRKFDSADKTLSFRSESVPVPP